MASQSNLNLAVQKFNDIIRSPDLFQELCGKFQSELLMSSLRDTITFEELNNEVRFTYSGESSILP